MFRWIREAFGHKPGGVHTRIATFRPKAPPPDPRAVNVEFTGRELVRGTCSECYPEPCKTKPCAAFTALYSFPEGTTERLTEESRALGVRIEAARRLDSMYGTGRYEQQVGRIFDPARYNKDEARRTWGAAYAHLERAFERMAEEHDADRFDAASY
jgi:hypothetical protein